MTALSQEVEFLIDSQKLDWGLAKANYEGLALVETKKVDVGNVELLVQFNPKRIVSSAAKVDPKSIQERKCFLCSANLPAEQKGIDFEGKYQILINPFPIFPKHLTIPAYRHIRQEIAGRLPDMLSLTELLDEYVVFYNGAKCGASAPDHFHFQAGSKGFLPLEQHFSSFRKKIMVDNDMLQAGTIDFPCRMIFIQSGNKEEITVLFEILYQLLGCKPQEYEPMMNIIVWRQDEEFIVCIFPRAKHRPDCFYAEGEKNILLSPASVDMGGVFITPQEKDFRKISREDIASILEEVCVSSQEIENLGAALYETYR